MCAVVPALPTQLLQPGRNDAGARVNCRPYDGASLGPLLMPPNWINDVWTHLRPTNDSWRVDQTYIEVKGEWKYLYRAVDSEGKTLDFMLSAKPSCAAERFFRKAMNPTYNQPA